MGSSLERIKDLEEELKTTKYNKRTQHHVGLVKAKLALLKEKEQKRSSSGGKGEGFAVKRTGDGTVIMVGFPSVGKSTLLNKLTKAKSEVGSYAFTTLTCIPGLLEHKHAKIQVLDVPGIIQGAASGLGRGKEVLACAQSADLALLLIDVFHPEHLDIISNEVREANLRVNERRPDVKIVKKERGGIDFGSTLKLTKTDQGTVEAIMKEFRLNNASIVIRDDITADQLIDVIENNKKYIPAITVLNKIDMVDEKHLARIKRKIRPDICISAEKGINIEELKDLIYERLGLVRIYCKEQGKKADLEEPLIMAQGSTLKDVCAKLHRDFADKFRYARVWGKSVKFDGQMIRRPDHRIKDQDIVEIHLR